MEMYNELKKEFNKQLHPESRVLALIALFMALYGVLHLLPISVYIGGPGFITAAILFVPIIAYIFKPLHALLIAVGGSIIVFVLGLATAPVFGIFAIFMPVMAMGLGSIAFRHWIGKLGIIGWLLLEGLYYSIFGGTVLWLIPYAIVCVLMGFFVIIDFTELLTDNELGAEWFKWFFLASMCYAITIVELAAMNTLSIGVLLLPPDLWIYIFPVAMVERAVALIGSMLLIKALVQREDIGELLEY